MSAISTEEKKILAAKAYQARKDILSMLKYGEGHIGGAFSSLDILTVLYNKILKHDPKNPKWPDRDRFVLSAGHKCLALYSVLAGQGYFPKDVLWTYNTFNTRVPMHPDEKVLPGIEFPTGSLGHGLPVAQGMAHTAKLDKKNYRVFVMLGDGESAEGSIWESIMSAGHHKLDNLIVILDRNGLQVNGKTLNIMNSSLMEEKYKAFGWSVRTIDGHDYGEIYNALSSVPFEPGKPSAIIADTIKCKGFKSKEADFKSHHMHLKGEELENAFCEIEETYKEELL